MDILDEYFPRVVGVSVADVMAAQHTDNLDWRVYQAAREYGMPLKRNVRITGVPDIPASGKPKYRWQY